MPRSLLLAPLALLAAAACGEPTPPPTSNPGPDGEESFYDFQIASYTLKGNSGVLSSWDAGNGAIYLGFDEVASPAGTVTIGLGPISGGNNGSRRADVTYAAVTVTPTRNQVGNTELWSMNTDVASEVTGIRTSGTDWIEGTVVIHVWRDDPHEPGTEKVRGTLTGTFRAMR